MKKQRGLHTIPTILFALAICCFFGLVYPHHLHFQEQYQLFQFDAAYALDVVDVPGGVADYIGRFFTQFFIYAWVGAAILALLLTLVQLLAARGTKGTCLYALSFVPAILLWRLMLDENAMPGAVVAVLLCLLFDRGLQLLPSVKLRCLLSVLGLPLLYWLAGPVALWLYVGIALSLIMKERRSAVVIASVSAIVLLALAMPTIARRLVAIDPDRLVSGVHYFRYSTHTAWPLWCAVASILLVQLLVSVKKHINFRFFPHLIVLATCCTTVVVAQGVNRSSEEIMAYDFMARNQMWNRILQTSAVKAPHNPTSATVNNLAMAMKGRFAEHMFDYPQRGTTGLLPKFVRDPFSPLATSEVFYHLGMINTAQQFVFEAQEAIPDYQKSARCYKRLAETNLINGAYDVARKYLLALRKTWFYRSWADETLALLGNEDAIARHPEYGKLRRQNIRASFFFSDRELPQMLGQLLMSNRQNRLAFEYLEATYMLEGDLDSFARCYSLGNELGYPTIPLAFQQALLLFWSRDHSASEQIPAGFRPDVVKSMHQFYADIQSKRYTKEQLEERWGKTYWYYYFYEK